MPAIAAKHTGTSTKAWDGAANEARISGNDIEAAMRAFSAWIDPEADPKTKAAYKFGHHFVDADGNVGDASTVSCSSSVGILNGGRGGTKIPAGDRKGVWDHMHAHMTDAGLDCPELKDPPTMGSAEQLTLDQARALSGLTSAGLVRAGKEFCSARLTDIEIAVVGGSKTVRGHAAVFDTLSADKGPFKLKISPDAFTKTLASSPDTVGLINHDPNLVIGRTIAGTLSLGVDTTGLEFEDKLPNTSYANDLAESMGRGDMNACSFGWWTNADSWETDSDGVMIRQVDEADLDGGDISVVTFPRFVETDAELAGMLAQVRSLRELAEGKVLSGSNLKLVQSAVDALQALLDAAKPAASASAGLGRLDRDLALLAARP